MSVIYLLIVIISLCLQNTSKKPYTQKNGNCGIFLFNAIASVMSALFFVLTAGKLEFSFSLLPYSLMFALCYTVCMITLLLAVAYGSLSLTGLVISYSLIIPTFYGIFFLHEPVSFGLVPGLLLLAVSLFLINKVEKGAKISAKWVICAALAFVSNGFASVAQNFQQSVFEGKYKSEFMIIALFISAILMIIISLIKERKDIIPCFKNGWLPAAVCGISHGATNFYVMVLFALMPVSILFPVISAGGIISTFFVSKYIYKEQLSKGQLAGLLLGIASVIFLNI